MRFTGRLARCRGSTFYLDVNGDRFLSDRPPTRIFRLLHSAKTSLQISNAPFESTLCEFTRFGEDFFVLDALGSDSLARLEVGESHVSASSPWGERLGLIAYLEPIWPVRPFPKRCSRSRAFLERYEGLSTIAERVQAMEKRVEQLYGFTLFGGLFLQNAQESQCGHHCRVLFTSKR